MPDVPENSVEPVGDAVTEQQLGSMSAFQKTLQQAAGLAEGKQTDAPDSRAQLRESIQKSAEGDGAPPEKKEAAPATLKSRVPAVSDEDARPSGKVDSMDSINQAASKARGQKRKEYNAMLDAEEAGATAAPGKTTEPEKKAEPEKKDAAPAKETSAATKETVAKADSGQPVTMQEIDAALADPNISKRHRERMQFLANEAKKATELQAKVAEMEGKLANAKSAEEFTSLTKKIEETEKQLMLYRRRVEASEDPEIKTKYDAVITAADTAITGKLKELGVGEKMIEVINKMGGFDSFSRSNALFNVPVRGEGDKVENQQMTAAQLAKAWLDAFNVGDSEFIRAKMQEKMNKTEERAREIKRMGDEAETYFKAQREQDQKARTEQEEKAKRLVSEYHSFRDKWIGAQQWLKDKEVPAGASDEVRKEIEEHNKQNALVRQLWDVASNPQSVEEFGQLVGRAAASVQLQRDLAAAQRRVAELEEQNKKLQGAHRTTPKSGGVSIATPPAKREKTVEETLKGPSAIDNILRAAETIARGAADE